MKRQIGIFRIVLLQLVPVVSLLAVGAAMVHLHDRYRRDEGPRRAAEVSRYELRRLTATFNYRLNELREELMHLYGEQLNLARALNEQERERLVFYRRDHLAGYAVVVRPASAKETDWQIQKYYVRQIPHKGGSGVKPPLEVFTQALKQMPEQGYWIGRVDARPFNAPWIGTDSDGYVVAYRIKDDEGQPFGVVGVYRPSYVFPFCSFFGETLGEMPVNAFVLNDQGKVVCHSQARYAGTSFKEYSLYGALTGSQDSDEIRYSNVLGANVAASIRKVNPGGFILVAESAEQSPWRLAVPERELMIGAGIVVLLTLLSAVSVTRKVLRAPPPPETATAAPENSDSAATNAAEALPELSEFTKLRMELKETESTLLEMQATQALVASFQKAAVELPASDDLGRLLIDHIGSWKKPVVWCPADMAGREIHCGPFENWSQPLEPFQIALGEYSYPSELAHEPDAFMKLSMQLKSESIVVQPVYYESRLLGLLVVDEPGEKGEVLPQLAQIFAFVSAARMAAAQSLEQGTPTDLQNGV